MYPIDSKITESFLISDTWSVGLNVAIQFRPLSVSSPGSWSSTKSQTSSQGITIHVPQGCQVCSFRSSKKTCWCWFSNLLIRPSSPPLNTMSQAGTWKLVQHGPFLFQLSDCRIYSLLESQCFPNIFQSANWEHHGSHTSDWVWSNIQHQYQHACGLLLLISCQLMGLIIDCSFYDINLCSSCGHQGCSGHGMPDLYLVS